MRISPASASGLALVHARVALVVTFVASGALGIACGSSAGSDAAGDGDANGGDHDASTAPANEPTAAPDASTGAAADATSDPGDASTQGVTPTDDDAASDDAASDDGGASDASVAADAEVDSAVDAAADAAPHAPLLDAGASCTTDDQCVSGGCDDTKHCALGRSCTQENGGRTCGADGGDSCCEAIAIKVPDGGLPDAGEELPTKSYTLDKYNITAGRMRQFIEKTDGGVRQYVQAHRPDWFDPGWDSFLPKEMDDGTTVTGTDHVFPPGQGQDGVYQQLGPIHYGTESEGNEGCLTKEVGNARTYRLPDDINSERFNDVQQYSQADLDPKPVQCATFFMLAAFCIWDGGRPPTVAELDYAWDEGAPSTHIYPWGNAPVPAGWDYGFDTQHDAEKYGKVNPVGGDQTRANHLYNWWSPSTESCLGGDASACDYSVFLAPPGRFPNGNGPFGHADLAGNVYSYAMPETSVSDPTALTVGLVRSGAFDGHPIPTTRPRAGFPSFAATNKYLAIGMRCAR